MTSEASDQELLAAYGERGCEEAFAEVVRRHVNVVHSAARRMVREETAAEDVTQQVFLTLARRSLELSRHPVLCGWLHQTTRNLAGKVVRAETRRRQREKEVAMMREELTDEAVWERVSPYLDQALGELSGRDRDAVLLRYFHGKSAREIGGALKVSEEAAQKCVTRAVERLRRAFERQGIRIGAQALTGMITSHCAQAAPAGLTASITSAVAGVVVQKAAFFSSGTMFTPGIMQKSVMALGVAAAVGTGLLELRQSRARQAELGLIDQRLASVAAEVTRIRDERDSLLRAAAAAEARQEEMRSLAAEARRLRGELAERKSASATMDASDGDNPAARLWMERVKTLKELPMAMPGRSIPEIELLKDDDWIELAKQSLEREDPEVKPLEKWWLFTSVPPHPATIGETDNEEADKRLEFREVRSRAKLNFGNRLARALRAYLQANEGRLPEDIGELRVYFEVPPDEAMLARYEVNSGTQERQPVETLIAEREVLDRQYDTRLVIERSNGGELGIRLQDMVEIHARKEKDAL